MRDLQQIFSCRDMNDDDLIRVSWWRRGIFNGYAGNSLVDVPTVYINEYLDGLEFGNDLYNVTHKGARL